MKKTTNICTTIKDLKETVPQSAQADLIRDFPGRKTDLTITDLLQVRKGVCEEVSWKALI